MSHRGNILAVVGGQYGSEGKGVIVNHVADKYDVHVRVGGANAGHSFKYAGQTVKMQSIPCGWTNRNAVLFVGRGGLIAPDIVARELKMIAQYDSTIHRRLFIDPMTGVVSDYHHEVEGGIKGELHQRIGSTGEGIGAARIARLRREPENFEFAKDVAERYGFTTSIAKTPISEMLDAYSTAGKNILLEGTQGCGLSLIHGPWPYVTTADTNAAQMAADCGIPPRFVNRTCLVIRTFPIRVAGNSGPLKGEMTWEQMSKRMGKQVEERTTVTKKIRRIGEWDPQLVDDAVTLNAPTSLALTFADYLSPEDEGKRAFKTLSKTTREFIDYLEDRYEIPVALIGTGGSEWAIVDRGMAL
jgi:adenylosuccinate synthase